MASLDRSFWRVWGRELCLAPPESDRAHHAHWMIIASAQALGIARDRPLPFRGSHRLVILTGGNSGEIRALVRRGEERPFCPYWGLAHIALADERSCFCFPLARVLPRDRGRILRQAHQDLRDLRPCTRDLLEEFRELWDITAQK